MEEMWQWRMLLHEAVLWSQEQLSKFMTWFNANSVSFFPDKAKCLDNIFQDNFLRSFLVLGQQPVCLSPYSCNLASICSRGLSINSWQENHCQPLSSQKLPVDLRILIGLLRTIWKEHLRGPYLRLPKVPILSQDNYILNRHLLYRTMYLTDSSLIMVKTKEYSGVIKF